MIRLLLTLLATVSIAQAQTLKPGDMVKPDAVAAAEFLQGTAPKEWEKDKVYILECWATWCGPCVAAIPHMNELHKKYGEKGLRVIGMNVWEEEKEKVVAFLKEKGDGMAYPVAFVNETAFAKEWLEAGGVEGIPHAFVVKNGKLLFSTHPASLKDETIEALLEGGEKEAKVLAARAEEAKAEEAMRKEAEEEMARLGDFPDQFAAILENQDFAGGRTLVEKTLKENDKLTKEDKQMLILTDAMLLMELKQFGEARKRVDEAVALAPESEHAANAPMARQLIDGEEKAAATQKAAPDADGNPAGEKSAEAPEAKEQ